MRLFTELLERLAQRLAAAVNQSDLMAVIHQQRCCASNPLDHAWLFKNRASDFEHDLQFSNPVVSGQPYITFMFCRACPAAAFIKLSMHETSTSRSLSGESAKPMSQRFVRSGNAICGSRGGVKIRTNLLSRYKSRRQLSTS